VSRIVIAGNWKMFNTVDESTALVNEISESTRGITGVEIMVCPPFTSLLPVKQATEGTNILLGAQNMHHEENGAFTGAISPLMLRGVGCTHVILGHSERRWVFNETDEEVNLKVRSALDHQLSPIVCVGERLDQRETGATFAVVELQVRSALKGVETAEMEHVIIAYEPVWAIGTGLTATPEQAGEVHTRIRRLIAGMYNDEIASELVIQYGGSVKPDNVAGLMAVEDINGALVGGASLDAASFAGIIKNSV